MDKRVLTPQLLERSNKHVGVVENVNPNHEMCDMNVICLEEVIQRPTGTWGIDWTIIDAQSNRTIWSIPNISGMLALVIGRADRFLTWIRVGRIDGIVTILRQTGCNVRDEISRYGSVKRVEPRLWNVRLGEGTVLKIIGRPFCFRLLIDCMIQEKKLVMDNEIGYRFVPPRMIGFE
jgi:hypothetical protein